MIFDNGVGGGGGCIQFGPVFWFSPSFMEVFNPQPHGFTLGTTDEEVARRAVQILEEQIIQEGPHTIAAVMMESVVGSGGVLLPPDGYMQGVTSD